MTHFRQALLLLYINHSQQLCYDQAPGEGQSHSDWVCSDTATLELLSDQRADVTHVRMAPPDSQMYAYDCSLLGWGVGACGKKRFNV